MLKVLLALDESPVSLRAAREAGRLFPDAEFYVINVAQVVVPWVAADYGSVYPLYLDELPVEGLTEQEVTGRVGAAGIEPTVVITTSGDPTDLIVEAAEANDVDVLVVGSHEKGLLARLFDPSVARAVTKSTNRPVLVVSGNPSDR